MTSKHAGRGNYGVCVTRGIRSVVNYGEGAIRSAETITHGSF